MSLLLIIPDILSLFIGYSTLCLIWPKSKKALGLKLCIGFGLGFIISAHLGFYSLIVFKHFSSFLMICLHLAIVALFLIFSRKALWQSFLADWQELSAKEWMCLGLYTLVLLPLCLHAFLWPNGSWDAWAIWNFKSRMIFLGDSQWCNMFEPLTIHMRHHYPFFLPLVNCWSFSVIGEATPLAPMINGLLYSFMTGGLMLFALKPRQHSLASLLPLFVLYTLPHFLHLVTIQYADILIAFHFLAIFVCYQWDCEGDDEQRPVFLLLAGFFAGALAFIKDEGLVCSILLLGLIVLYEIKVHLKAPKLKFRLGTFLFGFLITALPGVIFFLFFRPQNLFFINGLTSVNKPTSFARLGRIFSLWWQVLLSPTWNYLWLVIAYLSAWCLGCRRNRTANLWFAFVGLYALALMTNYFINTYFAVDWWIICSLDRLLMTLMPGFLFIISQALLSSAAE